MDEVKLAAYDQWLENNLELIVRTYPGKVIAVYKDEIIIVGDSEEEVYRDLQTRGLEEVPLVFRVPREEDFQCLLSF